ncbi:MAG TPA: tripartite tricarboxylate transporter substrate binding protein [Burkholderiales bacterium]|nr:tripartite tricarboxylate transporter substrate binding protein [Burkholderiales bacterium]
MKPMTDCASLLRACAAAVLVLSSGATLAASAGWKPERPVEFIIPASAGGGQDRTARVIQKILQDSGAVPTAINIANKGGGGGNIAYNYLQQFKGDGHYLATASPTLITNHILGTSPISYTDVTPLNILYNEYIGFAVNAEGPMKSGADLVARLKKDPESVTFAFGTSRGNANHIAVALMAKAAGVDVKRLKVVIYKSSIDAATALMGGHVDAVATPTSTYVPLLGGGKIRLVAVAAPARQGGVFANVPTWKEQGLDVIMPSYRMVIGPRDMSPAQVAFWDQAFARAVKSPEWKKELEKNDWDDSFLDSTRSRAFLDQQSKAYRGVLVELGLVKQ